MVGSLRHHGVETIDFQLAQQQTTQHRSWGNHNLSLKYYDNGKAVQEPVIYGLKEVIHGEN